MDGLDAGTGVAENSIQAGSSAAASTPSTSGSAGTAATSSTFPPVALGVASGCHYSASASSSAVSASASSITLKAQLSAASVGATGSPTQSDSGQPDDQSVIFTQADIFTECLPVMREIRRQGKLCDVTLQIEDQSFSAHRIVLAATIPYFYAMFMNNMAESRIRDITMKEIEPHAMESLINFAYSGSVRITNQNVQGLMVGAAFLQLTKVRDACADFLVSRFNAHNVLGIRQFGDQLVCPDLVRAADKFVHQYFAKVVQSEEFTALGAAELLAIIRCDELNVSSEEAVFEACMRWIKHLEPQRAAQLPQLLAACRLPLLTPQYLADRVATESLVRSSHQCRDLLDEARDYHLMPERRGLIPAFRTQRRSCDFVVGAIYAVGGLTMNNESVSTVEMYDPQRSCWQMGEAMSMLRSRVGVAVNAGKLYAFGGFNGTERLATVEVYDPKQRTWTHAKAMLCKRSAVGVASLYDRIYVCGGYDGITSLSTVECYAPKTDSWTTVAPMMRYRSAGGVAALGEFVYALGGHDGLSIFDSVERYDPVADVWHKVQPMLNRRCRLGVAALGGKLYACGGYDGSVFMRSVERYDPERDAWQLVAPMNVKRSRVALAANMGKLWAIGGYDGETNLSTVEVYDPETDEWSFVAPMCAHGGGVGAGVIAMN